MKRSGYWKRGDGGSVWVEVWRFRLMSFGNALGPWRETRAEAEADAIQLGVATRYRGHGTVYLTVPAWIAQVAPCAATERGLRRRREGRLVEKVKAA